MAEIIDIVYDGHCTFCRRALRALRRIDTGDVIRLHDSHDPLIHTKFPMLKTADFDDAMFAVTAAGGVYRGYFAFKQLVLGLPLAWPLLPLFYVPGSSLLGTRVYAWVARNRRSFGCEAERCDVPPSEKPSH